MVPENEFHHKEQPVRSATPANLQNGPGSAGKPTASPANAGKPEEGTAEDAGESPQQKLDHWALLKFLSNVNGNADVRLWGSFSVVEASDFY